MDTQAVLEHLQRLPPWAWGAALLGLVALVFAVRVLKRYGRLRRYPGLQPRFRSAAGARVLAAAEASEKRGAFEEAGDLFLQLELHDGARRNYHRAQTGLKLAGSYLATGQKLEAATWFERAGRVDEALELYLEVGQIAHAARAAQSAGDFLQAAQLFEGAGDFAAAAPLYRRIQDIPKAFACYEKAGEQGAAAALGVEHVGQMLAGLRQGKKASAADVRELESLAERAAAILAESEKASDWEQGLQLYLFAKRWASAGHLFRKLGKLEKAVEQFLRAGDKRNAADVLDELGRPRESAKLKGEDFLARDMLREAAAQFETAELWEQAAEALVKLGDNLKAALLFRRMNMPLRTAELLEKEGQYGEAAAAYREAGDDERALHCYEQLSDWGAYTELLEAKERWYEAGLNYLKRGLSDKAIKALQRVDEHDPRYGAAALALGDLFAEKGMHGLAKEKYLALIGDERIQRRNIEAYYKLALAYEANQELNQALQTFEKILGLDFHFKDVGQRIHDLKERIALRTPFMTPAQSGGQPVDPFAATLMQPAQAAKRRYEIVSELGRGGMGVVYKARDTVLDRVVALKVLPPMFRQNELALRNFFREAKSAAALQHPNIVTVYDTGEEAGSPYITMEFVEGRDLKQIVSESGAFALGPLLLVFGQMCQALTYAHERSIVHRDIKPSNVLWTKDKQVKVTDFGLARALNQGANTMTTTGGTPYYMSPEQTLGKNLDHRTDIYSLGVMMFELATARLPFEEGDIGYHHVHSEAPNPSVHRNDLPPAMSRIILRCLAKKADERYATAADVFRELRESFGS